MNSPMRSGQRRIEYSPELLKNASQPQLSAYLTFELYRILLQHPYSRRPYNAKPGIMTIASDAIVYQLLIKDKSSIVEEISLPSIEYLKNQASRFHNLINPLGEKWAGTTEEKFFQRNLNIDKKTGFLTFVDDLTFEEAYRWILFLVRETSIAGENAGTAGGQECLQSDAGELWEENQEAQQEITENIQKAEIDQGWGGLGGNLQRQLQDSCDFSFDYRRALTQFRQNIVSANRKLTRMRPSRRYGFKAMGSRYERKANILIAIDVSGSITDQSFEHFSHAIKNFFFLGLIEKIDLIFFDVNLKNTKPITFRKKVNIEEIKGRGGTSFQPPIDFYTENSSQYSGMIIFTDGDGPIPQMPAACKNILWIMDSRLAWEKASNWIKGLPGNKSTYLPF
ncbi:MAG: VWA-like domain-containing protein [Treponema sp.]|nr:VWA-like domain-containing protein [Treponema sp.]